jgi:beta-fructofuranosidase
MEDNMFTDHRPVYHFVPKSGWMNDPNGPLWYEGYYHMFYQYNPTEDNWGNIHWGHARSRDLCRWEYLPIALCPSPEFRECHCFSGCAVMDGEVPVIVYTSVGEGDRNPRTGAEQRMARSVDHMQSWQKLAPAMLTNDIHPEAILEWRDPFIWKENGTWNLVLGGSLDGYGCVTLYRSSNLRDWKFINIFYSSRDYSYLECPNLLRFGNKSVLFYSPGSDVIYHIGTIDRDGRFVAGHTGILDHSGTIGFYAPNTYLNDPKGRYVTFGWITENARKNYVIEGYQGALSLPRVLSLDSAGILRQKPAEEIDAYLSPSIEEGEYRLNNEERLLSTRGRELEICVSLFCREGDDFSLNVYRSANGEECTRIHYNAHSRELTLEKGLASLNRSVSKEFLRTKLDFIADLGVPEKGLELRIFLDHSIIEIFADNRETISGRLYPSLENSDGISLSGTAAKVIVSIRKVNTSNFL